jgi:hypothetical protein
MYVDVRTATIVVTKKDFSGPSKLLLDSVKKLFSSTEILYILDKLLYFDGNDFNIIKDTGRYKSSPVTFEDLQYFKEVKIINYSTHEKLEFENMFINSCKQILTAERNFNSSFSE